MTVDLLKVNVNGTGIIAEFSQELISVMKPLTKMSDVDFMECLPHAEYPNYDKYQTICILVAFSWLILIFEPYALRLRNKIMELYYPQRAEDRTVWLYHEIMRKRTGLVRFARQQLTRKIFGDNDITADISMTCAQVLKAKLRRLVPINTDPV